MPQTLHLETHFTALEKIRDIVLGMSRRRPLRSAWQTALVGGLAVFGIARMVA